MIFKEIVDAAFEARQHRHEPLANLLPQPLPLRIRGIEHGQAQVVALIDDIDRACLHRRAVELKPSRAHLDADLLAVGGSVRRAKGARRRHAAARCVGCERVRTGRDVSPRESQELFHRVAVGRHGGVVDDEDASGRDILDPHRARAREEEAPVSLDGRRLLLLDLIAARLESRQEQARAGEYPDESPLDLHRFAPADAAKDAELQAKPGGRADGEKQRGDRGDRDAKARGRPHHQHQSEGQQRQLRPETRQPQCRSEPRNARHRPQQEFSECAGVPSSARGCYERQQRNDKNDAAHGVRPPPQRKQEKRGADDEHIADPVDAGFIEDQR